MRSLLEKAMSSTRKNTIVGSSAMQVVPNDTRLLFVLSDDDEGTKDFHLLLT